MKIIDAHNHPDWAGHDLDRFLANMDQYGISRTWLLNWETQEHEYLPYYNEVTSAKLFGRQSGNGPIPFERCVSYMERAPEVKCRMMYDSPDALRMFRLAGELKMPVVLHMQYDRQPTCDKPWGEWYGGTVDTLERVLQACPETIFLGHAPGFWIHISNDEHCLKEDYPPENAKVAENGRIPALLRKYPNLYCDISAGSGCRALSRDLDHAKKFLLEFQDRILYARDYFDNAHQELINTLDMPSPVLENIYHGNAERLLGADGV
ncbi:MAG: amidohydrolase family protein [Lentisphaerae bacterium]|nr:amidohydrolase family protein [Lentisphaerota bacterium]